MALGFLFKGLILGFSIAAPVGPIGLLCIRRTLAFGRLSGLCSGLGAAVADTFYGIIAAFGVTLISDFLIAEEVWLRIIGGAFLVYLGGKTFFAQPLEQATHLLHKTLLSDFFSTFLLTLTNPMTILAYVAIFAGLGLADMEKDCCHGVELILGVFCGSSLWWLILSEGVTLFRKKVSRRVMVWINRSAGLLIVAFGLFAWCSLRLPCP